MAFAEVGFLLASIRAIRGHTGFREQGTSCEIMMPNWLESRRPGNVLGCGHCLHASDAATVSDHRWLVRSRLVLVQGSSAAWP